MMKKAFAFLAGITFGMNLLAQQDPIIMRINNKDITRSEFEYSYNKNNNEQTLDQKTLDEYVDLFINFKLKVAEAEALRMDTLKSFQNEFKGYRSQQAQDYLIDKDFIEEESRRVYEQTKNNIGPEGLVRTAHILLFIPQDADVQQQQQIKARMDSIHTALVQGADFSEMAIKFSQDASARQGGELPWLFAKQVYSEYAQVAYSLQVGELSQPFLSPAGVHVVKLLEKKQFEPYEFHQKDIHAFLERRGVRQEAMKAMAEKLYKQYGGTVKREDVLAYEDSLLESKYPEFRYLMQEYYDGLLLFEVSNLMVWDKASKDEEGLERYFKKNKKKYVWDSPRFKGAVIHCATPELATRVKKEMKKMPEDQWRKYILQDVNKDSLKLAFMEKGLFRIGDNANVDYLVFGQGKLNPKEQYPYAVSVGKVQKKRPDSYRDVRGPLTADYQKALEEVWIKELREKYAVEVFREVVNTVNKH